VDVWALLSAVLFVIFFSYWKHKVQKSGRSPFSICQIFDFEKQWSSAVLNFRNLPRLFRIKVTVRVRLRIAGGTPPYREWEHNASLSSINSKNLWHERLLGRRYGFYRVPFFFISFLIEKDAKSRKVVVVTFILSMQSAGYNHIMHYCTIGDQLDGRIFLLVGCHCIVNMLYYYYYYCHNIVFVNKLVCLVAPYDMR